GGGALPASLGLHLAAASGQLDAAHERWRAPAAPRAVSVPPDGATVNGAGDRGDAGPRDASCPRPAVSQRGPIPVGGATEQKGARAAGRRAGGTSLRSTVSWLSYAAWCRGVCCGDALILSQVVHQHRCVGGEAGCHARRRLPPDAA